MKIPGSTVTITDEGTYILSGTLRNGRIVVDAVKTDKTQLVLIGVSIHSEASAPVSVLQADKVFIALAPGSSNVLSNGGSANAPQQSTGGMGGRGGGRPGPYMAKILVRGYRRVAFFVAKNLQKSG